MLSNHFFPCRYEVSGNVKEDVSICLRFILRLCFSQFRLCLIFLFFEGFFVKYIF